MKDYFNHLFFKIEQNILYHENIYNKKVLNEIFDNYNSNNELNEIISNNIKVSVDELPKYLKVSIPEFNNRYEEIIDGKNNIYNLNLVVRKYIRKEDINLYFYDEENIGEVIKGKKSIKFFGLGIKSGLNLQTESLINIPINVNVYDNINLNKNFKLINLKYSFFHDANAYILNLNDKIPSINNENILGLINEKGGNFNKIKLNSLEINSKKINCENLDNQQNKITQKESQNEKKEDNEINIELEKLKEIFYCEINSNLLYEIFQLIKDKEDLKGHYKKDNINSQRI